jgi:hypothetical protein
VEEDGKKCGVRDVSLTTTRIFHSFASLASGTGFPIERPAEIQARHPCGRIGSNPILLVPNGALPWRKS